jgi:hypothetical protein
MSYRLPIIRSRVNDHTRRARKNCRIIGLLRSELISAGELWRHFSPSESNTIVPKPHLTVSGQTEVIRRSQLNHLLTLLIRRRRNSCHSNESGFDPDEVIRSQELNGHELNVDESTYDPTDQLLPGIPFDVDAQIYELRRIFEL